MLKSIALYWLRHWRGELSLTVSFWINIVALNLLVLGFIDPFLNPAPVIDLTLSVVPSNAPLGFLFPEDPIPAIRIMVIWAVFKLAILYPWQFVGLMRSCNRYVVGSNKTFWARTAQLLAVIGISGVIVNTNQLWPDYRDLYHFGFVAHRHTYQVELIKDGTIIHLKGDMGWGVSKDVSKILRQHSGIKGIILDSNGGLADEGYRLSTLVRLYDLDTYTLRGCYSACTIVFISGEKRFLGRGSFLGFHQSSFIGPRAISSNESAESLKQEKEKDLVIFNMREISHEFFEKASNTPPDDAWYPTVSELFDAGVIHEIINPSDLIPSNKVILGFILNKNMEVLQIWTSSNADRIQLQKNDVLLQWDDVKLNGYDDFLDQRKKMKLADPYRIKIRRNKSVLELEGVLR